MVSGIEDEYHLAFLNFTGVNSVPGYSADLSIGMESLVYTALFLLVDEVIWFSLSLDEDCGFNVSYHS